MGILNTSVLVVVLSFSAVAFAEDPIDLPDSPGTVQTAAKPNRFVLPEDQKRVAPWSAQIISTDYQVAAPLPTWQKPGYALRQAVDPTNLVTALFSAGWSHMLDSSPHYGNDRGAFAERFGSMALNNATQTVYTIGVFDTLYHQDPRYYRLGRGHGFAKRAVYAAANVVIARTDSGRKTVNYGLLSGYLAAAATNNLYFPQQDRGFTNTIQNYFNSMPGAAVGFEVHEFIVDGLRLMHLSKDR